MSRQVFALTVLFGLLAGWTAQAQQTGPAKAAAEPVGNQQRLAEDIEVLRRILNRSAESLARGSSTSPTLRWHLQLQPALNWEFAPVQSPPPAASHNSPTNWFAADSARAYVLDQASNSPPPGTEGVYLKGYGILYTLTLPASRFREPKSEPAKAATKPPSEWELTRKEVRGEKGGVPEPVAEPHEPSLREVILKILAENGRHLEQLADTEQVTVVVTLRGTPAETVATGKTDAREFVRRVFLDLVGREPTPRELLRLGEDSPEARAQLVDTLLSEEQAKDQASRAWKEFFAKATSLNEHCLLGDLHLKQNRYPEAIKAFTAALKENPSAKEAADICRKLAQACLAAGDVKAAEAALTKARQLQEEAPKPGSAPAATASRAPLPAKLTVSATKKLLDQVGAGKLTLEEFQKAATVEYQTFGGEAKAK